MTFRQTKRGILRFSGHAAPTETGDFACDAPDLPNDPLNDLYPGETAMNAKTETPKRQHKATYSRDNRNGGYLIRVEGPTANAFAGRTVPVTLRDDSEHSEKLLKLIWAGTDKESGKPVALYTFENKPKEAKEVEF